MTLEEMGKNIERIRLARGWTRNYAAQKALLHHTHLKRIKMGLCNIRLETILRIAERWEVSLADLFNSPDNRKRKR